MKFLELINKCLLELNYKEINSMSELVKNDHKRIVNILNIVNKEICNSDQWDFLLNHETIQIPQNTDKIEIPVYGRIIYFIIDGKNYTFCKNVEPFLLGHAPKECYSVLNDKILIPAFNTVKNAEIFYYTGYSAKNSQGILKDDMQEEDDQSLIPMPFCEQLLVYGTCLRLKGNPSYIRFSYWMSMYKEALINLRSKSSLYVKDSAKIRVFRK